MMYMRNACMKFLALALTLGGLASLANRAQAQTVTSHIQFTHNWKYDRSGASLPITWRTNAPAYDDSTWATGAGLLGYDDVMAPYQVHVPGPLATPFPSPLSQTVTTYYFRTTFTNTINPNAVGLVLIATNLVDDGCAIWLNGRLAGGVRMPAGAFNSTTVFGGPAVEGQLDTVTLTNFLRSGVNTLAVEVHQTANTSSDVVWGMRLLSIVPTTLTITNQPDDLEVSAGESASFTVGVSGGPVVYRWFKDGGLIANATNSTYSISVASLANAGNYWVVVSNAATAAITSSVARLVVTEDTSGPLLVSAIIDNGFGSNRVNVKFSEVVTSFSARNTNNYRLVPTGTSVTNITNASITVTNIAYSSGQGALLFISDPDWNPVGSYYLIVNNVADSRGNNINPNSVIGVGVQIFTNLAQMSDLWSYYDCSDIDFCDPDSDAVYANEAFSKTNFVQGPLTWGFGRGIFVKESGLAEIQPCAGDVKGDIISFQLEPTLFRRTFVLPNNASSNGELRIRFIFDDGMLVYLNGQPLYSNNVVGPITKNSRAISLVEGAACTTNVTLRVLNLRPGTNWLAAAVVQHATHQADTVFGFEMDLVSIQTSQPPTNRAPGTPRIVQARQTNNFDKFILSWPATNYGYALMYSTDIVGTTSRPDRNWFTNEANWTQVKDQANPYTNSIPPTNGPRRFYKLYREKLN
jgi:Immunoglobulin domain